MKKAQFCVRLTGPDRRMNIYSSGETFNQAINGRRKRLRKQKYLI
jgi:hypothetical protein